MKNIIEELEIYIADNLAYMPNTTLRTVAEHLRAIIEEYKNAQDPQAWSLKHENVEYQITCFEKDQVDEYIKNGWQLTRTLFTHPPLSDETVKDAARYQWLRENVADPESKWCVYEVSADQHPDLDGAIDKAMIDEAKKAANAEAKA
jgi:hypothetical protein